MSTTTEMTDRDIVQQAATLDHSGRAIAAAEAYIEIPDYDSGNYRIDQGEQDAFVVGWTAGVVAVLNEVRALVGPNSLLQLSGLSVPFILAVDDIARRFEVES